MTVLKRLASNVHAVGPPSFVIAREVQLDYNAFTVPICLPKRNRSTERMSCRNRLREGGQSHFSPQALKNRDSPRDCCSTLRSDGKGCVV